MVVFNYELFERPNANVLQNTSSFRDYTLARLFNLNDVKLTQGNSFKLTVPSSGINARADFFPVRVINVCNALSTDRIVNGSSISSFNSKLLTMDLSFA